MLRTFFTLSQHCRLSRNANPANRPTSVARRWNVARAVLFRFSRMRNEKDSLLSGVYREGQRPRRTLKGGRVGTIVGSPRFFRFLSSEKGRIYKKANFVLVQTHLETSTLPSTFKYRLSHKSLPRNAPSAPHLLQPTRHCHPTRNALPAYHLLQPISISNNLMRNALPIPAPSQPRQTLLRLPRNVSSAQYLPILLFLFQPAEKRNHAPHLLLSIPSLPPAEKRNPLPNPFLPHPLPTKKTPSRLPGRALVFSLYAPNTSRAIATDACTSAA